MSRENNSDAQATNLDVKIGFIAANCSLLNEVSRICQEIRKREDEVAGGGNRAVNLLALSQSSSGLGVRSGNVS